MIMNNAILIEAIKLCLWGIAKNSKVLKLISQPSPYIIQKIFNCISRQIALRLKMLINIDRIILIF